MASEPKFLTAIVLCRSHVRVRSLVGILCSRQKSHDIRATHACGRRSAKYVNPRKITGHCALGSTSRIGNACGCVCASAGFRGAMHYIFDGIFHITYMLYKFGVCERLHKNARAKVAGEQIKENPIASLCRRCFVVAVVVLVVVAYGVHTRVCVCLIVS